MIKKKVLEVEDVGTESLAEVVKVEVALSTKSDSRVMRTFIKRESTELHFIFRAGKSGPETQLVSGQVIEAGS